MLWFTASAMFLAAGFVIGHWVLMYRIEPANFDGQLIPNNSGSLKPKVRSTASLLVEHDFIYVWNKPLRRPLVDVAPPVAREPVIVPAVNAIAAKPLPEITLAATFMETDPASRRAWLILPGGVRRLVNVGQSLDELPGPPIIAQIEDRRVVIKWENTLVIKELPPDASRRFESL